MKKINVALICSLFLVAACERQAPAEKSYIMPEDLKDCKVIQIDGDGPFLYVVRCPNSTTSTRWEVPQGKSRATYTSVYIDGVEYTKVVKEPEAKKDNTIMVNGVEYQKVEKSK